ncbi:hypothetical protein AAE478_002656 [Parahypoxylon ruwenzoriense]
MAFMACLLPLFLLCPALIAARGFVPHGDNQCRGAPLTLLSDGEEVRDSTLVIDRAITDWHHAAGRYYDNVTFPDARSSNDVGNDTGTLFVHWKVEQPDPGCQFILMKDTSLHWQIMTPLPGVVILRADREGCYFAEVTPNENLITSFCCGTGDCSVVEIESSTQVPNSQDQGDGDDTSGEIPECKVERRTTNYVRHAGVQHAVTRPQSCAAASCLHSVTESTTASTAISHTESVTWTTAAGFDVSFEAGVNFIGFSKVSVGITAEIARSWMTSTGTTVTTGNISAAQESGRQVPGTTAFYSFTPWYRCWKGNVNCGQKDDGKDMIIEGVNFCQPEMMDAGYVTGLLSMVYTGD